MTRKKCVPYAVLEAFLKGSTAKPETSAHGRFMSSSDKVRVVGGGGRGVVCEGRRWGGDGDGNSGGSGGGSGRSRGVSAAQHSSWMRQFELLELSNKSVKQL